jgi:hypothetical protein
VQRAILNFPPGPQGWTLSPRGELCPLGECLPLHSPPGVNTLYCLVEWRGEQWILHPGDNFTPGDNFAPGGQSLPLGAKLRMGLRTMYVWQIRQKCVISIEKIIYVNIFHLYIPICDQVQIKLYAWFNSLIKDEIAVHLIISKYCRYASPWHF